MPANDYYDSSGTPSTNTLASSASMRAEFDAVEAGFTAVQAALALKAAAADMTAALALKANATNAVLITPNIGTPSAGVVTNLTGTAAGVSIGGNAATATLASTVTTNANLTGDVTSTGNVTTLTNASVIAKVLTGYTSGAGTVAATDSILQAIQKLNGNDATNANLTGDVTSVGNATTLTNAPVIAKVLTGYTSSPGVISASDSILTAIQKLNGNQGVRPKTSISANYTFALADAGGFFHHPSSDTTARTWTIPANASVAFVEGTEIVIINSGSAGIITLSITTDELILAGAGTTGSRSIAPNGKVTLIKSSSTTWFVYGYGLT